MPPVPKYERRRIAVPLSFITQGGPLTLARRRASTSPALPGARSQLPPQARLQPVTRPLCSLEVLLLFPINTLFHLRFVS